MTITTRHAHLTSRGPCSLVFAAQTLGRKIVTCGGDGLIKMHDLERMTDKEDEPIESDYFSDPVLAVSASPDGKKIAAGSSTGNVAIFNLPDLEFETVITRSSLHVRDICYSPDGDFLAVASDDSVIKVISCDNPQESKNLEGHSGGVKCIAYDPRGQYLVSTGCDQTLRVWDSSSGTEKFKLTHAYSKDAASATDPEIPFAFKNLCKVAWCGMKGYTSNPGRLIAIAGSSKVRVFERDTWKELEPFPPYGTEISIVEFSPNGKYLLTVDINGELVIWNVDERDSVVRKLNSSNVMAARWDPLMNSICAVGADGHWGVWNTAVPDKYPDPTERDIDDASDVADDVADEDDVDLDELEARGADVRENDASSKFRIGKNSSFHGAGRAAIARPHFERQAAFQPQCTKMEHKRRFMVFTAEGFITCRSEAAYNAIEIEFADVKTNRPVRFNDYSGYSMAALGSSAAMFASAGDTSSSAEDAAGGSLIHYRAFASWAPNADWTINLPSGEQATTVAVGDGFGAVTTSRNYLRIFTFSGLEKSLYTLPGPAVCMHGRGSLLAVVYHLPSSPSYSGDQDMEFQLLDVSTQRLLSSHRMCLSPGSTLEWLHVAEGGVVACMDSEGIVSVFLAGESGGQWCPVLDIRLCNKPRDWFWPIGLDEERVTGVVCKIEKRYPDVIQPVISQFDLRAPLALKRDSDQQQEEQWYRGRLFLSHDERNPLGGAEEDEELDSRGRALDAMLCRLFDAACKGSRQVRALDLVMSMRNKAGMDVAHRLAAMGRLSGLAERIDRLRQLRFADDEEGDVGEAGGQAAAPYREGGSLQSVRAYQRPPLKRGREEEHEDDEVEEMRLQVAQKGGDSGPEESEAEGEGAAAATHIGTPPLPPAKQQLSGSVFVKKSLNQDAQDKERPSFQDRLQSMRQKPAEPLAKLSGARSAGGGVFGRPLKTPPTKPKSKSR